MNELVARPARVLLAWLLIIAAESVHGTLRQFLLAPVAGDLRARQIGVVTGALIVFAIACALIRWLRVEGRRALLATGALWVMLTVLFEAGLGRALGYDWSRILADYRPQEGGFMALGLAVMLVSPLAAARLRGTGRTAEG
jgi:hypothetical protein